MHTHTYKNSWDGLSNGTGGPLQMEVGVTSAQWVISAKFTKIARSHMLTYKHTFNIVFIIIVFIIITITRFYTN